MADLTPKNKSPAKKGLRALFKKQVNIRFTRKSNRNGKYRTHVSLELGEKHCFRHKGPIHRLLNLKYRIVGDVPTPTRAIKNMRPRSIKGYIAKGLLLVTDFIIRDVCKTAADVLKASETAAIEASKHVSRAAINELKSKYRANATDDFNKGSSFIIKSSIDAAKGTCSHFKLHRRYACEKKKYKVIKQEFKTFKKKNFIPEKKKIRSDQKKLKKIYKIQKKSFSKVGKKSKNYRLRKLLFKRRKQVYKSKIKEIKNRKVEITKELRRHKSDKRIQRRIKRNTKPGFLILSPVKYYGRQMKNAAVNKAIQEDDNDLLKAVYEVKKHGVDHIVPKSSKSSRLRKAEKKKERNFKKSKLQKKEKAPTTSKPKRKRKRNRNKAKSTSPVGKLKNALLDILKSPAQKAEKEVTATLLSSLVPVILLLLLFYCLITIIITMLSNSGFVLGTYNAQDYHLSQAETYYTKLAFDMNESIMRIDASNWKKGLKELGVDTKDMKDKPNVIQWGRSNELNYDPVYDFDKYKLWSFLCAYYYDFSENQSKRDIKYWKYGKDTEDVIRELFETEYTFEYKYNSSSRWEHRNSYIFSGGIDGTYWLVDKNTVYTDSFHPESAPGEIYDFTDNNGFVHISNNLEVLNAKDSDNPTGWFIQDQRYVVRDNSGQQSDPFYSWFNNTEYGRMYGNQYHPRARWGWGDNQCYWLVSPDDTLLWNSNLSDKCLVNYYKADDWIEECSLYYNIKQNASFEDVILKKLGSMPNGNERIEYYHIFVGDNNQSSFYGNHQTLQNLLFGDSIRDYTVFNDFGWNTTEWNTIHCNSDSKNHEGVDIECSSGSKVLAPFDCEIQSYKDGTVVLRKNDVRYWYDGNKGKKRDTEVTIGNIELLNGFKIGDKIKTGTEFAHVTDKRHCDGFDNSGHNCYIHLQVKIDTDGIGWHYINPLLIIY